jgi:hypothetical protein
MEWAAQTEPRRFTMTATRVNDLETALKPFEELLRDKAPHLRTPAAKAVWCLERLDRRFGRGALIPRRFYLDGSPQYLPPTTSSSEELAAYMDARSLCESLERYIQSLPRIVEGVIIGN